jgi:hypothetical protein
MKDQGINNFITLTKLAIMLQCEIKSIKVADERYRLILIPIQKFMDFVLAEI